MFLAIGLAPRLDRAALFSGTAGLLPHGPAWNPARSGPGARGRVPRGQGGLGAALPAPLHHHTHVRTLKTRVYKVPHTRGRTRHSCARGRRGPGTLPRVSLCSGLRQVRARRSAPPPPPRNWPGRPLSVAPPPGSGGGGPDLPCPPVGGPLPSPGGGGSPTQMRPGGPEWATCSAG